MLSYLFFLSYISNLFFITVTALFVAIFLRLQKLNSLGIFSWNCFSHFYSDLI